MQAGTHARVRFEQACGYAHRGEIRCLSGDQRAAGRAERAEAAWRGFVAPDRPFAAQPAEPVLVDMGVGGEACAGQLAADRAMAVRHRAHCLDLEPNAAAGAAPLDHRLSPSAERLAEGAPI